MPMQTNTHMLTLVVFCCEPASNAVLYISNDIAVTMEGIERYHTVNSACGQVKRGIWGTMGFITPALLS